MPENVWRGPFKGAYRKGAEAHRNEEPRSANPYDFSDVCGGGPTFARSFHRAWLDGYNEASLADSGPRTSDREPEAS